MTMLFAVAVASIIDRALYGPSNQIFGNNRSDNLEQQGTSENSKGGKGYIPPQTGSKDLGYATGTVNSSGQATGTGNSAGPSGGAGDVAGTGEYSGKPFSGTRNPDVDFTNKRGNSTLKIHFNDHVNELK